MRICDRCESKDNVRPRRVTLATTGSRVAAATGMDCAVDLCDACYSILRECIAGFLKNTEPIVTTPEATT